MKGDDCSCKKNRCFMIIRKTDILVCIYRSLIVVSRWRASQCVTLLLSIHWCFINISGGATNRLRFSPPSWGVTVIWCIIQITVNSFKRIGIGPIAHFTIYFCLVQRRRGVEVFRYLCILASWSKLVSYFCILSQGGGLINFSVLLRIFNFRVFFNICMIGDVLVF